MPTPPKQKRLLLPVVTAGSEFLVMGHLMRRNILTYKAPQNNEGYDLICIHPDPRHQLANEQFSQVRVQVKSRYATDADQKIPLGSASLEAFDFLIVALLNIGDFYHKRERARAIHTPVFYTLPTNFVREHHRKTSGWKGELSLKRITSKLCDFEGEKGFELIAFSLGIGKPQKTQLSKVL